MRAFALLLICAACELETASARREPPDDREPEDACAPIPSACPRVVEGRVPLVAGTGEWLDVLSTDPLHVRVGRADGVVERVVELPKEIALAPRLEGQVATACGYALALRGSVARAGEESVLLLQLDLDGEIVGVQPLVTPGDAPFDQAWMWTLGPDLALLQRRGPDTGQFAIVQGAAFGAITWVDLPFSPRAQMDIRLAGDTVLFVSGEDPIPKLRRYRLASRTFEAPVETTPIDLQDGYAPTEDGGVGPAFVLRNSVAVRELVRIDRDGEVVASRPLEPGDFVHVGPGARTIVFRAPGTDLGFSLEWAPLSAGLVPGARTRLGEASVIGHGEPFVSAVGTPDALAVTLQHSSVDSVFRPAICALP